jgi:uncharacterized protein YjdB
LLASLLIGLAAGAFGETTEPFELAVASMTMNLSQTYEIERAVVSASAAEHVTWVSDDESVVTVQDGVLTAKHGGSANVTATLAARKSAFPSM